MVKHVGSNDEHNNGGQLDRWFVGNHESIEEYYKLYSRKIIITPKVLTLEWLRRRNLTRSVT